MRYQRVHNVWSLENFNDGYINKSGRFRVYFPEHPRADKMGYIFRSIVTYETHHGVSVPIEMVIHHINENRLDDSKENLLMLTRGSHSSLHNQKRIEAAKIRRVCKQCKQEFTIKRSELKGPSRTGSFCSKECYFKSMKGMARVPSSGRKRGERYFPLCRWCGKPFEVYRSIYFNPKTGLYCSKPCKNNYLRKNKNRSASK